MPYTIMNPECRITLAAITENKHLSAVLAHIKKEQDKAALRDKAASQLLDCCKHHVFCFFWCKPTDDEECR